MKRIMNTRLKKLLVHMVHEIIKIYADILKRLSLPFETTHESMLVGQFSFTILWKPDNP